MQEERSFRLPLLGTLLLFAAAGYCAAAAPELPAERREMRLLWEPRAAQLVKEWLILGPFPSMPFRKEEGKRPGVAQQGFSVDYLLAAGGEAKVRPAEGQKLEGPDGSLLEWRRHLSEKGVLDFISIFSGQSTLNCVVYAFAQIEWPEAGPALLSLGSDDSVKVYLNGSLVHENAVGRALKLDEDRVDVDMREGRNDLLVKVENGLGDWGLAVRVLTEKQAAAFGLGDARVSVAGGSWPESRQLKVEITGIGRDTDPRRELLLEIRGPGGRLRESSKIREDGISSFDPAGWPDGPYEIALWQEDSAGLRVYRDTEWYKGDWEAEVSKLLDEAEGVPAGSSDPRHLRVTVLADLFRARLEGDPRHTDFDPVDFSLPSDATRRELHSALMEYSELEMGPDADVRPHGFVRLAWRDPIDDSPQFARAYLPPGYDPAKAWPLVVNLHGYNGANPEYIDWWSIFARHEYMSTRHGVIVVEPMGRYNTGYEGLGEIDVLRAVEMARKKFSVDGERIYLWGQSMGGGGTWLVGTHNPHIFAAIAPIYGGWDYHVWLSPEETGEKMPGWQRHKFEAWASFAQAESLLTTPVFVHHGDADSIVDPELSRYAVRMLERWGYDLRYREHPDRGHEALGVEDQVAEWFLKHKLAANPRQVRLRAPFLKTARAHWLRVLARENPLAMIQAKAEIMDRDTIRVDTDNALKIALAPGAGLVNLKAPIRVIWNGEDAGRHLPAGGEIVIEAEGYRPGKLAKNRAVEGGIRELFNTPFAVVAGTISDDPLMRRLCLRQAELVCADWLDWQHSSPRFFFDTEVGEKEMRGYSLLLFGGPEENSVTRKLAGRLPLKISPDGFVLGGEAFQVSDGAVTMIYPSPYNQERYVCVRAANSPQAMYFSNYSDDYYDFSISDGLMLPDEESFGLCPEVAKGSFGDNWEFDPDFLVRRDGESRERAVALSAPRHADTDVPVKELQLSRVLEDSVSGSFMQLRRDLNWRFQPLRLGGKRFNSGISVEPWDAANRAEYKLAAGWKRLRGRIGLELYPGQDASGAAAQAKAFFVVHGDGKEIYRSPALNAMSRPVDLDVDVSGVETLTLEVSCDPPFPQSPFCMNWVNLRLRR